MLFDFTASLSNAAQGESRPYAGYPSHHFVGGNIDEPSVPNVALAYVNLFAHPWIVAPR